MKVGKMIKEYRTKYNLSQTAFGKLVGVNKQTISKWEIGGIQPSSKKLFEICQVIGVSVVEILKDENQIGEVGPFIYTHKVKYEVGLNSLYHSVHDFDTFCAFVDAMESAHRLLETDFAYAGFLLIDETIADIDSRKHTFFIHNIYCVGTEIFIEIPDNTLIFAEENICNIECSGFFNNELYGFIIYLSDKQETFIQLVLSLSDK